MTRDIAMLCSVFDAGDDSALPVLADAMEEAGLAPIGRLTAYTTIWGGMWGTDYLPLSIPNTHGLIGWGRRSGLPQRHGFVQYLPPDVFSRLRHAKEWWTWQETDAPWADAVRYKCAPQEAGYALYRTRSAAYLALAEALTVR